MTDNEETSLAIKLLQQAMKRDRATVAVWHNHISMCCLEKMVQYVISNNNSYTLDIELIEMSHEVASEIMTNLFDTNIAWCCEINKK